MSSPTPHRRDDDEQQPLPAQSSHDESQATPTPSSPEGNTALRTTTTTSSAKTVPAVEGKSRTAVPSSSSHPLSTGDQSGKPKRVLRAPSNDVDPVTAQKRSLESGWSLAPIHSFDKSIPVPPELLARSHPPSHGGSSRSSKRTGGGGGELSSDGESGGSPSHNARSNAAKKNPQYGRIPLPPIQNGSSSPVRTSTPRTAVATANNSPGNKAVSPTAAHHKIPPSKELAEAKNLALLWLEEKKYESRASSRATTGGGGGGGHEIRGDTASAECAAAPPWANASATPSLPLSTSPRHSSPLSALLLRDTFSVTPANPAGLFEGPKGYDAPLSYQERINQAGKLKSAPFLMTNSLSSSGHHGSRPPTRDIPGSRSGRKMM
ncbi:Hypothetical protein, putative [Bodo saltans]|uniref:Uncharacterized protein n=1 Tax=Bodo saltans TaxID=75058 RepID=A0A0S4IKG1_BODSA|nr:Hypothetical protein, putative [Bodo saltans]|eukprot:CUE66501.1 Hypothetical protein, putative [Bodo saltans]